MSQVSNLPILAFHAIKAFAFNSSFSATKIGTQIPALHSFCSNLVNTKNTTMEVRICLAKSKLNLAINHDNWAKAQDDFARVLANPACNPARYGGLTRDAARVAQEIFHEEVARIDAGAAARAADIERRSAELSERLTPRMLRYAECSRQLSRATPQ